MSSSILDIGAPCTGIVTAPTLGMAVKKSGRTTGFTTGSITVLNATISVRYSKSCGSNGGNTASFTGQIGFGQSSFSAGGDSGSVIFDTSDPEHAVALLFAGNSSTTFGNPIGPVLSALGVSMVGSSCLDDPNPPLPPTYTQDEFDKVVSLLDRHSAWILRQEGVVGHGVGIDADGKPVPQVFVEHLGLSVLQHRALELDGVPVEVVETGPIYALGIDEEAD